jgi:hypothetical protein
MACWLLTMFVSTLFGIIMPTVRWYFCNEVKTDINININTRAFLNSRRQAPWNVTHIAFIGCYTVSAVWVVLAEIAALIE